MIEIITPALISGLIVFVSTPLAIWLANRWGLVDDPKIRKHPATTHEGVIPRAGGMPIFLGIFVAAIMFIPMSKIMVGILLCSLLTVFVGVMDDYYDLSPYLRFTFNIMIAIILVLFGLGIPYVSNPLGGVIHLDTVYVTVNFFGTHKFLLFANLFAVIWIAAITNFVNWSKGVDGQLPGFVTISAFFLGILAQRFTAHHIASQEVALFSFIVAAAFLGFLPHNFFPQKIMPGYSGGALAGLLLAILSILSWGKLGTLMLVLSVPFVDAIYVMTRRLLNFRSPFWGDAGHFHHRLLDIGWGKRRVAAFYWLVSFFFGLSSLFLESQEKLYAFILVLAILAGFILITNRVKGIDKSGI